MYSAIPKYTFDLIRRYPILFAFHRIHPLAVRCCQVHHRSFLIHWSLFGNGLLSHFIEYIKDGTVPVIN